MGVTACCILGHVKQLSYMLPEKQLPALAMTVLKCQLVRKEQKEEAMAAFLSLL